MNYVEVEAKLRDDYQKTPELCVEAADAIATLVSALKKIERYGHNPLCEPDLIARKALQGDSE